MSLFLPGPYTPSGTAYTPLMDQQTLVSPCIRGKHSLFNIKQQITSKHLGRLSHSKHYSYKANRSDNTHSSYLVRTDPVRNMQSGTQVPPLLYFLQVWHWFGPGPQQPFDEHRGSHTWPALTAHTIKHRWHTIISKLTSTGEVIWTDPSWLTTLITWAVVF